MDENIGKNQWLYWGYLGASIVMVLIGLILGVKFYLFNPKDGTLSDLFLLFFVFMGSVFFRLNAFHYQKMIELKELQSKIDRKMNQVRKEGDFK